MRSIPTAIFLQVVLDWMSRSRDVELSIYLVDDQWRIADDGIARSAALNVTGTIVEVEPAKIVLVDAHHDQLLDVAILVLWQRRVEVERCDLVFLEILGDQLIRMLASDHCMEFPAAATRAYPSMGMP